MKIYTRTGDSGETSLYGGSRRSKADPRVMAYGEVDELQASLGAARSLCAEPEFKDFYTLLGIVQSDCFVLSSELARASGNTQQGPEIGSERIAWLEAQIDRQEEGLPSLRAFILPGGGALGSHFHLARAVCRRAERACVLFSLDEPMRPEPLAYLNRLSDLLFVSARTANLRTGHAEEEWRGRQGA